MVLGRVRAAQRGLPVAHRGPHIAVRAVLLPGAGAWVKPTLRRLQTPPAAVVQPGAGEVEYDPTPQDDVFPPAHDVSSSASASQRAPRRSSWRAAGRLSAGGAVMSGSRASLAVC